MDARILLATACCNLFPCDFNSFSCQFKLYSLLSLQVSCIIVEFQGFFGSSVIYLYESYFHSSFRILVMNNVCLYSAFSFHFFKINSQFSICFILLCQSWKLLNCRTAGSYFGATYDDLNSSTDKLNLIMYLCWCQWEWRLIHRGWFALI